MVFRSALNEYSSGKQGEAAQNTPNVINLFYSHYEYENEYHIGSKESILYHAIKKLSFPDSYKNAPYGTYPIGGDLAPSFIKRYKLPATFAAIELSDPFIPKLFEYQIIYQYDNAGNPTDAEISIWLFSDKNEGEQLTICIMVRQKPDHILIIGSILGISNINSPLQNYTLIAAVPKAYFPAAAKKGTVQLIGGFSLGAVTTWYEFCYNGDLIKYFLPLSGDCWIMGTYGGRYQPKATTNRLEQIVREKGYTASDYEIYVAVGTRDPIWDQANNQLTEMLTRPAFSGGNVHYAVKQGGRHDYDAITEYFYNALPLYFKK